MTTLTQPYQRFFRYQLPVFLWCCVIFVLSSIPSRDLPKLDLFSGHDKVIHAGIYFVFCWLVHRAFLHQRNAVIIELSLFLAIVATVVYGCSDEFHQLYVAGRSADIYDLLADTFGGMLYAGWFLIVIKRKRSSASKVAAS
ncbi:MAG: VanZ family protein [Ignavibacteriales bacterium]|nr:VanZ family protein [Ignavibacteriales bacterium]